MTPKVTRQEAEKLVASVHAWHHRFEIAPGVMTPGSYDPRFLLDKTDLPDDLSGQRVLDIGPSDGFFSLNLRRRGAEVVAVDYRPKDLHGFGVMERISGLDFDYRQANIYDITAEAFGTFDIVVFFGVLYHLPDMIKALSIVRSVCSSRMFLETHCAAELTPEISAARYYREDTLNQDMTNFWSPNALCLRDMLYDCAFDVKRDETWAEGGPHRYFAECRISKDPARARKLRLAYGLLSGIS
jgi:tRNA (mo5U34)-methyltransferase